MDNQDNFSRFCKRHREYLNPDSFISSKLPPHLEVGTIFFLKISNTLNHE